MSIEKKQQRYAALGLFLLTFSIFFLLSPGRIDTTDSQVRYDATLGVIETGLPIINNHLLQHTTGVGVSKLDGNPLASLYAPASQLVYAPFLKLIKLFSANNREVEQFWFSHINQLFSALIIVLLFYFYINIGYQFNDAIKWCLVFAFCTQFFVTATSSFHQIPQAFFLFSSIFCAFLASRKHSPVYSIISAILFGVFLGFKVKYIIFAPGVIMVLIHSRIPLKENIRSITIDSTLFLLFIFLFIEFWHFYYGIYIDKAHASATSLPSLSSVPASNSLMDKIGKTLSGILVVLVSPGKGLLFFSPLLFVSLFNWKNLLRTNTFLAAGIGYVIFLWIAAMGSLNSPAGDWCWGNRYIIPIAPLMFLLLPATFKALFEKKQRLGKSLIIIGLCVQLLGLSIDYYRFFLNNSLPQKFFTSRMFYFQHSQLVERPFELIDTLNKMDKVNFNPPYRPGPLPESTTYAIYGISLQDPAANQLFLLEFPLLWLPRPWPLWIPFIDTEPKLVNVWILTPLSLLLLVIGIIVLKRSKNSEVGNNSGGP